MPPNNQNPVFGAPASAAGQPVGFADPNAAQMPQNPFPGQPVGAAPGTQAQQQSSKPAAPKPASTQNSLKLSELREDMVIMDDGSFRAVIACKSINFDLMSNREREGIEFSYQNFLNALYFPVQILVRSQRVDLGPYLDKLMGLRQAQDNMLLGVLMDDYINFIDVLSQEANIMDKSFFVVVPYFPTGDITGNVVEQGKGFLAKLMPVKSASGVTRIDKASYDKAKDEIKNRVDAVINGLSQVGVSAVQLNTKQLGELYYNAYNPDTAVREPLGDFTNVTATYVRRAQGTPEGATNG